VADDFLYGDLNSWTKPTILNNVDPSLSFYNIRAATSAIEGKDPDVTTKVQEAIVLYAWYEEPHGFWKHYEDPPKIVHVKARVITTKDAPQTQQINPALPADWSDAPFSWPLPVGNNPEDEKAGWSVIRSHPTYVESSTTSDKSSHKAIRLPLPQPRDIISVTFESLRPPEGLIYLGIVGTKDSTLVAGKASPAAHHEPGKVSPDTVASPPVSNPRPLEPNELPEFLRPGTYMIFGDSQARGGFGRGVEARLKSYGLSPVAGWNRSDTSRVGSPLQEWVPMGSKWLRRKGALRETGVYVNQGRSGPNVLQPFLDKKPDNVVIILGANSSGYPKRSNKESAKQIVDNIYKIVGSQAKIVWSTPSTSWQLRGKTFEEVNESRSAVALAITQAVDERVHILNLMKAWKDQTKSTTRDGVHLNKRGAEIAIDRTFPPRKK